MPWLRLHWKLSCTLPVPRIKLAWNNTAMKWWFRSLSHPCVYVDTHLKEIVFPIVSWSPVRVNGRAPKTASHHLCLSVYLKDPLRNPSREITGDTVMFRDTQIGSSAVYQCNASNEHGYLLANAFVNVLGEHWTRSLHFWVLYFISWFVKATKWLHNSSNCPCLEVVIKLCFLFPPED